MIPYINEEGMEHAVEVIETARAILDKMGNEIKGVDLKGKERVDSGNNNEDVALNLQKSGRDFFTLKDPDAVAQAIAEIIEEEINKIPNRGKYKGKSLMAMYNGITRGSVVKKRARNVASKAYIEGMKKWAQEVFDNIRKQQNYDGSKVRGLTLAYRKWKLEKYKFAEPVGVATGQLKENIDPSNTGNIKLHKGV